MIAVDRLPAAYAAPFSRWLWIVAIGAVAAGVLAFATGTLVGGVIALWAFVVAAVAVALVLPLPYAVVSPLFMGLLGWLVDMLPLLILSGWTAVVLRWVARLVLERRPPRGGWWVWLPIGLVGWTALGVVVITAVDFKHFLLLLGIQFVISGVLLAVVDQLRSLDERTEVVAGLSLYVVVLSVAVFLQWVGVPIESLQDTETRRRVEAAYGLDAFPNSIGMIKYARAKHAGAKEVREDLRAFASDHPGLPDFVVFRPEFQAFENRLVVRFAGSARAFESELQRFDVELIYDNVALAPANAVPRLRSFPRNALTYAGVCTALFPVTFFLVWTGRRRVLGIAAVVACLFGAGFSLARGAWLAILIGIVYLAIDGRLSWARKAQVAGSFVLAAALLTGIFLVKYHVDPLTGRAGGGASVNTRSELYEETAASLRGVHLLVGFGTERPRTETGTVKEGQRYVPRAGTHSTYLNYLFRAGLPAMIAIMAVYAISWLHARAAARVADGDERVFRSLLAAAIVSAAAHAVILSLYVEPTYTLTVSLLLGLGVAGATQLPTSILPWRARTT